MQEILFLCGVFDNKNASFVEKKTKKAVEYSSNNFQLKLIDALARCNCSFQVLSAPFIGAYPTHSRIFRFKGFRDGPENITYVRFHNLWGYRNFSRAYSLKKKMKRFLHQSAADEILLLVYAVHDPYLEAAKYAKYLDHRVKVCLIAPDLPQYMNLANDQGVLYRYAKKIDLLRIKKHLKAVDSFVLLTEQMKDILEVGDRKYIVAEGIVDQLIHSEQALDSTVKTVTYTGKLYETFGIKELIDAFREINESQIRLVLCGTGDCDEYAQSAAKADSRIVYMGQVPHCLSKQFQSESYVLINPRYSDDEYTKYSFPSKNIEYLSTGHAVVAYLLPGMPPIYRNFIFAVNDDKPQKLAIKEALIAALEASPELIRKKSDLFFDYAGKQLTSVNIVERILVMNSQ